MVYPINTLMAARKCGMPLALGCSILMQETSGGVNEFGHDPTIFVGAGLVTEDLYLQYRAQRNKTGMQQGVGPCQLTDSSLQNEADNLGGCWKPVVNMYVGFKYLLDMIRQNGGVPRGTRAGVTQYNGSGPEAVAYAQEVEARTVYYAKYLNVPNPF